ncbi:uncharacterized protein LOC128673180 isoform X2 [Plodia interpunctella]|uniref:uncharacterized protein LOC128673180 isoform X2 n=1 Tax=Plodia interpunctella TaxID=58824 RepID=UPI0023681723|nr:uncharacterized protein LOC128673180 isoform X2 [Plodia interpunctella]
MLLHHPSFYCQQSERFSIMPVTSNQHELAVELMKQYCLREHVIVKARKMDLTADKALDEYLIGILKQGNTLLAKTEDDKTAGICVGFASAPVDSRNLRTYAFYRQDPNTKDFLNFTAKMQETPNLWEVFKQQKIFEIKMLAVLPDFRRQGLAVTMVEKARETAFDQGFKVIRMDCLNSYDYKIAERNMMQCIVKFPLHKLRGPHAPFVKRSSKYNCLVRVYVDAKTDDRPDRIARKQRQVELESLIE